MATIVKPPSGSWRVQVRRKGQSIGETFQRREDARRWALATECQIDRGEAPTAARLARITTFGELVDLHIQDMCEVGKTPLRSKAATLEMLKRRLGSCNIAALDRERIIRFGRERSAEGAGPVTLSIDIGAIRLILSHAAAVHGLPVKIEPVDLGRIDLKRVIEARIGVSYHERTVGKLMKHIGFSHMSARPRHPTQKPETIATFKKTSAKR